jgi:hypothetical protein
MIVIMALALIAAFTYADCVWVVDTTACGHTYLEKPHCDTGCKGWRCQGPTAFQTCYVGETTDGLSTCDAYEDTQTCDYVQDYCHHADTIQHCGYPEVVLNSDSTICDYAVTTSCN